MGEKKELNPGFASAVQDKKIPLLILDHKWHNLFTDDRKSKQIVKLEKKANGYLRKQGKLNQEVKELKGLKERLMKNIIVNMDEIGEDEPESKKFQENRRLISEINEKLRLCLSELDELPNQLDAVNEALMIETMEYCYGKMRANEKEREEISKWIEYIRLEVKKNVVRKQIVEDKNREIYSYMHDIFGAHIIEIFDLKYHKEPIEEEKNKGE